MVVQTAQKPTVQPRFPISSINPNAAAAKLSALETVDYLRARAKRANLDDFDRLLARVPDTEPDEGDELQS